VYKVLELIRWRFLSSSAREEALETAVKTGFLALPVLLKRGCHDQQSGYCLGLELED
jgi:hypothetical protein